MMCLIPKWNIEPTILIIVRRHNWWTLASLRKCFSRLSKRERNHLGVLELSFRIHEKSHRWAWSSSFIMKSFLNLPMIQITYLFEKVSAWNSVVLIWVSLEWTKCVEGVSYERFGEGGVNQKMLVSSEHKLGWKNRSNYFCRLPLVATLFVWLHTVWRMKG